MCYDPLRFILSFADLFSLFSFVFHWLRHHPPINDGQIEANMINLYMSHKTLDTIYLKMAAFQPLTVSAGFKFSVPSISSVWGLSSVYLVEELGRDLQDELES